MSGCTMHGDTVPDVIFDVDDDEVARAVSEDRPDRGRRIVYSGWRRVQNVLARRGVRYRFDTPLYCALYKAVRILGCATVADVARLLGLDGYASMLHRYIYSLVRDGYLVKRGSEYCDAGGEKGDWFLERCEKTFGDPIRALSRLLSRDTP